jgi:general secretion pathway protein G
MKKGFTILELVIVLSVLVILIGIAIPRMKGMQQAGQLAQAKAELQTLQAAMESYYSNVHAYPPTGLITTPCTTYLKNATPQIVPSTCPTDPFSPTGAEYEAVVNGNYYAFVSIGTGSTLGTVVVNATTGAVTGASANLCVTNGSGC